MSEAKKRKINRNSSSRVASSINNEVGRSFSQVDLTSSQAGWSSEREFLKRSLASCQETIRSLMIQNEKITDENRRLKSGDTISDRDRVDHLYQNATQGGEGENERSTRANPLHRPPLGSRPPHSTRIQRLRTLNNTPLRTSNRNTHIPNRSADHQYTLSNPTIEIRNQPPEAGTSKEARSHSQDSQKPTQNTHVQSRRPQRRNQSTSPIREFIRTPETRRKRDSLSTPVIRNAELSERLKELESENLELRRRIAGLTPQNPTASQQGTSSGDQATEQSRDGCSRCRNLERQKSHQAEYFEGKLIETRETASEYRNQCETLSNALKCMESHLTSIQNKFAAQLKSTREKAAMYKDRSNRLASWRNSEMKGLQTDVNQVKKQVGGLEKNFLKTQLDLMGLNQYDIIYEELGRLMTETKTAEATLESLRDTIKFRENLPRLYI